MSVKDIIATIPKGVPQKEEEFDLQKILQDVPEEGYDCKGIKYKRVYKGISNNIDFTGQQINELTPLFLATTNKHKNKKLWVCKCSCGNIVLIWPQSLRTQSIKSCGCLIKNRVKNYPYDLSGIMINNLLVLERDYEYPVIHNIKNCKSSYWKCLCACGNITTVRRNELVNETTKGCGCLIGQRSYKDMTGQRIFMITIIKKAQEIKGKSCAWICRCDCGKELILNRRQLTYNQYLSCGCYRPNFKDLSGQKFTKLLVIKEYKEEIIRKTEKSAYWECLCDCGSVTVVRGQNLIDERVKSCGCLRSYGEMKIKQILNEANIKYKTQKSFDSCRLKNNSLVFYDFYINEDFLLEFDGQQHYLKEPHGYFTKEKLQSIQNSDSLKNNWAKENNIPLKRIPYWNLDNLTIEDIMSDKYLVT